MMMHRLDMRMSRSGTTAEELVNTLPVEELSSIISRYGEEKIRSVNSPRN